MSLFEKISNKITEEKRKQRDNSYLFDDDKDSSGNNKKPNQNKKFSKNIESGRTTYNKNKQLNQEISQRRTAQDRQQQLFSRQYDAYDDGDLGNPNQSKAQTTTQKTPPKNRPPRKGVDYFFDADKAKKEREAFRQGRKAYTDSKSGIKAGKVTDKGVIDYITKARNMKQGTNANTKANREAAKVIAKSSGSEYKEKIRTKYETDKDLPRRRGRNQPSYAEIKKGIDARNPVKPGQFTGKPVPAKTPVKPIKTVVTDKEIQDVIKTGRKTKPGRTKKITVGSLDARDRAIKDLDDLIIEPKSGDAAKTKKLLKKQQRIITKRITTPKPGEIEQQQKILDKVQTKPKTKTFKTKMDLSKPIKDPWFTGKDDYPDAFDPKPKSKKIGGKSFDDLVKDARRKNKEISQDIAKLKTKSFVPPKTTPLVTPPKLDPITQPLTDPLKKIKIKAPPKTKTGTFKKIMKFAGKNKSPIAKTIAYTAGAAYLISRFGGKTDNAPKNNKALVGGGNNITKVKPVTASFTLAGKGGDGYRPAGMKK